MHFEYKVVPAPTRGKKTRGVKTPAARFANALSDAINEMAAEGWEYLRTDTLPSEERAGLTGKTTVFQNMLVFRRDAVVEAKEAELSETDAREAAPLASPRDELETVTASHAPRLPGADEAQTMPANTAPVAGAERDKRDVAAE